MTRPVLLDLFHGAGGIADGYARAGFDVVGVDLNRAALRHSPHPTVQADAMAVLAGGVIDLSRVDAIHASPPCQAYSVTRHTHDNTHPDLLGPVVAALTAWGEATGRPWVVENVPGAPMPGALVLCGSEFGLRAHDPATGTVALRRHRLFLSNVHLWGAGGCTCAGDRAAGRIAGVYGGGSVDRSAGSAPRGGYTPPPAVGLALLGLDRPMPWRYLTQAIPPAYGAFIGEQLREHLGVAA